MNLMIVESLNRVIKIKAILGNGWDVAASVGHIRDLPPKSLGIRAETLALQYTEKGRGVVESLSRARPAPLRCIWPPIQIERARPSPGT